ncbi:nuclear intron maturase 1 -related [Anaeramoeba flamelloides]|uniref:Nuclear intron maturase 1 -related n=1 Tax=Anaeramoeba flamelloides TaxID=1746091 RepID=A0AAV7ZDN8_9EUKA|nr:nuclear intron maturase 1 -related [Anaeramoeba flamelloides]
MTKNTTEKKRLQMIKKLIIKIFKKEIHLFKTTEINYENFKNWIKKSINYSHLINFSNYARQSKYLIIELTPQLNNYLIKNKFKINYYLKPTTQYGFSEKYFKKNIKNYNSLIYANNLNKIRFYSFNISFFTIIELIDRLPIKRLLLIGNNIIEIWDSREGRGIYQGDPLSPILFAFVSHFLILKIKKVVKYIQMFADDMIIIIKSKNHKKKLKKIYKIIEQFGLKVNTDKTVVTNKLKKIKYLGIKFDKKHIYLTIK